MLGRGIQCRAQLGGQCSRQLQHAPGRGVAERQAAGVEEVPRELRQARPSVSYITSQRMAERGEVRAHLVACRARAADFHA
jgi:hypothetical protein